MYLYICIYKDSIRKYNLAFVIYGMGEVEFGITWTRIEINGAMGNEQAIFVDDAVTDIGIVFGRFEASEHYYD